MEKDLKSLSMRRIKRKSLKNKAIELKIELELELELGLTKEPSLVL